MRKKFLLLFLVWVSLSRVNSQTLVPNLPDVILDTTTNVPGYIAAFEHDSATHKLYIAGEFQRVGNVNRLGFAVIDLNTGAVLNDLNFIMLRDLPLAGSTVKARMKIFNNSLYIGGEFDSFGNGYLFSVNLFNNNITNIYFDAPLSDFEIYNGKIFTSGAYYLGGSAEYDVNEMDTLGNINWQRSITNGAGEHLSCLAIRNNTLFIGGAFNSFGGVNVKNIARVTLSPNTITSWQPTPAPGPTGNPTCYDVLDMIIYPNDILLNLAKAACANPPNNIAGYDLVSGTYNSQITTLPYLASLEALISENDTMFWYFNSVGLKLYDLKSAFIDPWSPTANGYLTPFFRKAGYLFVGGSFSTLQGAPHKGLGAYCLAPAAPKPQSVFTKACQGQTNIIYMVKAVKGAVSYNWSYTGTGCTIVGTGKNVTLHFTPTATSGTLQISANSYCGAVGDTLFIPFTVYPNPTASAGPDIIFTCSNTVDTLLGSSTTPGVNFGWLGPSFSSNIAINQVTNSASAGNYVLWVTDPASGCKTKDTAKVIFDTLPPVINHNLVPDLLTCKNPVVVLDAAPLYLPGDDLHWSGNSFSQSNPANITAAGIYTLTITSGTNDCISKDTFLVKSNFVQPSISAPLVLDTITCSRDSVQLPASTGSANTVLYWNNSNNDSLLNNSYTHFSGTYVAHALDTSNGCSNQLIRVVSQYTTPPVAQAPAGPFNVNCSFSTVVLNGTSPNPGVILNWSGPNGFSSSSNPITVNTAGYYVLTVTNPQNGCQARDSVEVTLQQILVLQSSNDTTICNGSSASIGSLPLGGTPGFTYSWSNGAGSGASVLVSPNDTTDYIVTITDNAGCVGTDTVRVLVPAALGDSVNTFQPCDPNNPDGEVQAFGTGGIPPYQYAINNGAFQSSGIFTGLNFGTYTVAIRDTLGCSFSFSTVIDTTSLLPAPDFILSTSQVQGDTFVLVDISNPRPDSVKWVLPANCILVNSDPYAPQIIHADTGALQITMMAWFGTCQMQLTKNIVVTLPDTTMANSHNNNGISNLVLYPNPNSGQFTVDVSFYKKQTFAIFIFDAIGNEILRLSFPDSDAASAAINLNNPAPGTYILKVIAEYDSETRTFLIDQQ